jgi:small-conductance mechanosensitive channel/CRP-like cAMP-binding protein
MRRPAGGCILLFMLIATFLPIAPGLDPLAGSFLRTSALLLAGILLTAFLLGRWNPKRRRKLRRVLFPFLLWLALAGGSHLCGRFGWGAAQLGGFWSARFLFAVVIINLAEVIGFDLLLPLLGLGLESVLGDLAMGLAYVVTFLVVMHQGGVDLSGLIATSAVLTAVIGLSLQATLGNIFGGMALQLDDSVHVGDWVQLENGRQGRVTAIRWRHTAIETRDWDTVIVPNSSLLAQNIILLGQRRDQPVQHRMWVYFNVDFRYAPAQVIATVEAALRDTPIECVAVEPAAHCICFDLAKDNRDSFAYYAIRYWLTDLAQDDPTNSRVRLRAFAALKRAGIPLAIPAAGVFLSREDPEHAEAKAARERLQRIAALDAVPLFNSMTREEKAAMAERVRPAPFTEGETITHQGAQAHRLYILTQGRVEIRYRSEHGDEVPISTIQAPGIFGELGMMTGAPRSGSVVSLDEVSCLCLDKADFATFIQHRPEIAYGMSKILAERQVELQDKREHLDAQERGRRVERRNFEILGEIRTFFGLEA